MKNKIISLCLVFALLFSQIKPTFAMSREPSPSLQISASSSFYNRHRFGITILFLSAFAAINGACGYLFGYKKGNSDHLDKLKEIHFEGTCLMSSGTFPQGPYFAPSIAAKYIEQVFYEDVPMLYKKDTFPATHLAAIEAYLRVISSQLKSCSFKHELSAMSQTMRRLILDEYDKPVTVGYLVNLLNQAKDLVSQAPQEISKQVEQDKKRATKHDL
ncbi:MAG: hypothetical protein V8P98_05755 [Acutalibacteraceae bacterium]|jgi:hypothetical protein